MPKTEQEYKALDRQFNGTRYDFDERVKVKHYIDKKHCQKVKIDLMEAIYIDPITQQRKFKIG